MFTSVIFTIKWKFKICLTKEKLKRSNSVEIYQYKFVVFRLSFNLDKNLSKIILLFSNACNMERNPTIRGDEIRLGND